MRKFVKILIYVDIPISIYLIFHFTIINNENLLHATIGALVIGTFVGVAVAAYIVGKSASLGVGIEDHVTRWSYLLEVEANREETQKLCRGAVKAIGRKVKFRPDVISSEVICARIGPSFKSWGEIVEITVIMTARGAARIIINSKSWFRWTIRDNGVNRDNCIAIANFIENSVGDARVIRSHHNEKEIIPV